MQRISAFLGVIFPRSSVRLGRRRQAARCEVCKPSQRCLLGGLRIVEALTLRRLEDVRGRKESEVTTVANNNACLECHAGTRWPDFDNVVVEHIKSPAAGVPPA